MATPTRTVIELSIVIPSRNAAAVLSEQLSALAAEDVDFAWEVIVVDNASADDTAAVAEGFSDILPVHLVSEPNRGRHFACNRGVEAARAEVVAFVDADDLVLPGFVGAMQSALQQSDVVAGRLVHGDETRSGIDFGNVQSDGLMSGFGFLPYASGGNFGVSKKAFVSVGGFTSDVPYGEDVDLSWRLILAGAEISFAAGAAVRVRQRSTLRDMFTQHRRFGTAQALLYDKYAALGMPRRPRREVLDDWKVSLGAIPRLSDPGVRTRWTRRTARSLGRIQGSLRTRRLYL